MKKLYVILACDEDYEIEFLGVAIIGFKNNKIKFGETESSKFNEVGECKPCRCKDLLPCHMKNNFNQKYKIRRNLSNKDKFQL